MGNCSSGMKNNENTEVEITNEDVAVHGNNAARVLAVAASSLSDFLSLINILYVKPSEMPANPKQGINDVIDILGSIAATSAGLGNTFTATGDFTMIEHVQDLNGDGVIDWKDKAQSITDDLVGFAMKISKEIRQILKQFQELNVGTEKNQKDIAEALNQMDTVDHVIRYLTQYKDILNAVKQAGELLFIAPSNAKDDKKEDLKQDEIVDADAKNDDTANDVKIGSDNKMTLS